MPFQIVESEGGDAWVRVHGRDYSPDQITAFIIQKMKRTAEDYLGQEISGSVLSVPAYFNDQQRQSTLDAAAIAGLQVFRLVAEPTMAALAYGLHRSETEDVVVYDLGGGTFDVSVVNLHEIPGVYEVKSTRGDLFLGGEDFDLRLVGYLSESFKAKHNVDLMADSIARQRLKQSAEIAKITLSSAQFAEIDLPFLHFSGMTPLHLNMTIAREVFENLIRPLVDRSIEVCRLALKDAGLSIDQINQVILVGGSTRLPLSGSI